MFFEYSKIVTILKMIKVQMVTVFFLKVCIFLSFSLVPVTVITGYVTLLPVKCT